MNTISVDQPERLEPLRFVHRLLNRGFTMEEAEDCCMTAFVCCLQLSSGAEMPSDALLWTCTLHRACDLVRRRQRERRMLIDIARGASSDWHEAPDTEWLLTRLRLLPEDLRSCVIRSLVYRVPLRDLAAEHSVSISTMQRRIARALSDMRAASECSEMLLAPSTQSQCARIEAPFDPSAMQPNSMPMQAEAIRKPRTRCRSGCE